MLLGEEAVQTLRTKTVAVAGCGGQGGGACLTLARMGVASFILADPKPFDEPDINRQWGANRSTLGRNKAEVYAEMLRDINPEVQIKVFTSGITDTNVEEFLEGADLLIDCLDISVSGALRKRLFSNASGMGMHIFTGAMLGFGGMVAGSYPGGIPLEFVAGVEDTAIGGSALPTALRDVFVPDHLARLERSLPIRRAPSIAVSPGLLAMVLSVESALALLGNTIAGWRPPVCLPRIILMDLLSMNFRVAHVDDLLLGRSLKAHDSATATVAVFSERAAPISPEARAGILAAVGFNTNLLPHDALELDLITDSWSEIPGPITTRPDAGQMWSEGSTEQPLQALYGYKYIVPVSRGRFAEALLCKALAARPGIVVSNSLFPTTRFHLETNGFTVREMGSPDAFDPASEFPFKGDLDIDRLREALSAREGVAAIYIELCSNALGGHPVSLANLSAVRALAAPHRVPVLVDGCRAFENAALIRDREVGQADRSLVNIVREIGSLTDGCASSCAKDFQSRVGGFIGTNDPVLFQGTSDLTLAFGDGLDDASRKDFCGALSANLESDSGSFGRVRQVQRLWEMLRQLGVPVVQPAGGHAVFVDARAMFPQIPQDQFPAQVLANELFLTGGVRGAVNFASPEQLSRGIHLVRLAIPVGYCQDHALAAVPIAFEAILAKRDRIVGLKRVGAPPGVAAEFAAEYRPVG